METNLRKIVGFSQVEKQLISTEKSIEIKENYKKDIGNLIESGKEGYKHTEFAWLSLETLKNYIAILDEVGKINKKEISGLRIYFAKYAETGDYTQEDIEKLKPGRETVFLAPTMKVEVNDTNKDYEVLQNVPFDIIPTGEYSYIGNYEEIKALSNQTNKNYIEAIENTSLIMNDIKTYPPPKIYVP
ncbi:MAG: hypothetical protein ACOVQ2_04625 [Flavobacterium sp.]|jgi:hypothetical protein